VRPAAATKSKIQSSKSEGNPKSQIQNPKSGLPENLRAARRFRAFAVQVRRSHGIQHGIELRTQTKRLSLGSGLARDMQSLVTAANRDSGIGEE
jgi:hypothetical protein